MAIDVIVRFTTFIRNGESSVEWNITKNKLLLDAKFDIDCQRNIFRLPVKNISPHFKKKLQKKGYDIHPMTKKIFKNKKLTKQ